MSLSFGVSTSFLTRWTFLLLAGVSVITSGCEHSRIVRVTFPNEFRGVAQLVAESQGLKLPERDYNHIELEFTSDRLSVTSVAFVHQWHTLEASFANGKVLETFPVVGRMPQDDIIRCFVNGPVFLVGTGREAEIFFFKTK